MKALLPGRPTKARYRPKHAGTALWLSLEGWVAKFEGWVAKFEGWVAKSEGCVAKFQGWVAKSVGSAPVCCGSTQGYNPDISQKS